MRARRLTGTGPVRPLLREEQGQVRQLLLAHLQERALRDLLLSRVRAAPGAAHRVSRERLPEAVHRPEARDAEADPGDLLQDPLRVRADQPVPGLRAGGGGGVHRAAAQPHGDPDRRAARPAAGADHARADARLRVRPDPARARLRHHAAVAAALGRRGSRGLLPRDVGAARPDDGPRRGAHRQGAAPVTRAVRAALGPAGLQHGPRRLRVHRVALRQGRHPAVPLHAAQGAPGRRARGALQAGLPHDTRGVRRLFRQVAEGALQAVPRPPAPGRLRPRPVAQPREDQLHAGVRLLAEPVRRDRGTRHRQPLAKARPTWC